MSRKTTLTHEEEQLESAPTWLFENLQILSKLQELSTDWESSGAERPNQVAIKLARIVIMTLANIDFAPDYVDPSTDEGVCISFRGGGRYADIECFNTGEILAGTQTEDGTTDIWELSDQEIHETISRLKIFISG